jgi:hypothetical protein
MMYGMPIGSVRQPTNHGVRGTYSLTSSAPLLLAYSIARSLSYLYRRCVVRDRRGDCYRIRLMRVRLACHALASSACVSMAIRAG